MNKKHRKYILITLFLLFCGSNLFSQNIDLWYKLSPEIRLTFAKNDWEFRWRPTDFVYVEPTKVFRTDIMIGRKFKAFKVFSYSKFDTKERYWTGIRLDYNKMLFNDKALINLQGRLFFGLNDKAKDHYYHVQFFDYKLNKILGVGVLGYGQTNFGETPMWFIGPSTTIKLSNTFGLHFAYCKDVFQDVRYLVFIRLNVKIVIGEK
ncbi:MAG: hypothetical protein K9J13_07390 [Saprospiraceae bacterium]|nr:hypothetical protein [Saprospiraceae bacterium]